MSTVLAAQDDQASMEDSIPGEPGQVRTKSYEMSVLDLLQDISRAGLSREKLKSVRDEYILFLKESGFITRLFGAFFQGEEYGVVSMLTNSLSEEQQHQILALVLYWVSELAPKLHAEMIKKISPSLRAKLALPLYQTAVHLYRGSGPLEES